MREYWKVEVRQPRRYVTYQSNPLRLQVEPPGRNAGANHGKDRPGARQHAGPVVGHARFLQQGLQPAAHPEEEQQGTPAHQYGRQVQQRQLLPELLRQLWQVLAPSPNAQHMAQLTDCDNHTRCSDKTGDHRVRQKAGQKAHAQQAEQQQHRTGHQRQQDCGVDVGHAPGLGDLADCCCGHQRHHGHRPHRQGGTGAEQAVGNERQHTGIQAHFGGQARQHGVSQRLRNQHDGHDHRRQAVAGKILAVVASPPIQ